MVLAHDIRQTSRTRDVQIALDISFDTMLLAPETLQGLKSCGFYKPSPIQLHGIPLGKCGFDLLLEAKSGTGKTAVFTVIALEKIDLKKGLQVVMLAPTREIAAQICDVIKQIGSHYKGLTVEVVMGGLPVHEDIEKFKKNVHIVVASPGRLRHLIQDKNIDTSSVRLLILDEADKLVEKSFHDDIKNIFSFLPTQKQVIMSSATYTETARNFINNYVQNAQHVCPDSNCVLLGVEQKITMVKYNCNIVKQTQNRLQEVLKIFSKMQFKQCLIFCNYQARVSEIHKLLLREKWPAEQLYGSQEQTDRLDALKTLQEYKCRILIATDLAARGIDASNIDLVINFEPPFEWQTYLHRIGRAGRYGSYGMAITILSEGVEAKKFYKMLEPMKGIIDITDLWCKDEISFDKDMSSEISSCGNSLAVIESNKEIEELWTILVSEERKNTDKLESFENLCTSFDKTTCLSDIKTFDELLQSFESNQYHLDDDLNFKHINMSDGQYKDVWVSLKQYLNMILGKQPVVRENKKIEGTFSRKPQSMNFSQFLKNKEINNNDNSKHNSSTISPSVGKIDGCKIDTTTATHVTREPTEQNYNPYDTRKALLDAGLPTEFGKSRKNKYSQFAPKEKRSHVEKRYTKSFPQELSEMEREGSNISHRKYKPRKHLNVSNDIYLSDNETYIFKNTNNKTIQSNKNGHTKCIKLSKNLDHIYENYADWYRRLKFQTKQIELAVYIDELSKL